MPTDSFYYEAKKNAKNVPAIYLEEHEEEQRRNDYEEIKGMKEHHKDQHSSWSKAGNFYNIVQNGEGSDEMSRYAVGLSRTIIDAGISMMNEGEPEGAFKPIGPSDRKISVLWDALVKHQLKKSNWAAHQKLFTTDLHIFGSSALEAFVNPIHRRPNEEAGLFLIRLATEPRVGLRHRSIWTTYRNPNVNDPDDVPSCAWEEFITRADWVTRYANRPDFDTKQVAVASKYKLTHICNELENTHRIYCLPYGTMAEATYEVQPSGDEIGYPVYDKRLTKLNPLGKCPMSFGIFGDQLTSDYKQHSLYGMGIPQLISGMEMLMEGLFNMTVDNMRLKNTVPVGYTPYQGSSDFPDFDNVILESGRVYPGTFNPTSLGIADLQSNTVMWEWINNLCIWITGYNFQQIGGDTSKTAYEFRQRLKANSNRAASRLKGLENGPLKRSWALLLANSLSQVTKDEWEDVTETQAKDFAELIKSGESATNDYKFENGKIKGKKFIEYFPVEDYEINENFKHSKKRKLDTKSTDNTLEFAPKKGATSMAPSTPEYLFPKGEIAHMLAFTTEVVSKTMLGDLRVQDSQAIDRALQSGVNLMQAVPGITPELIFSLWKQQSEDAGLDIDSALDGKNERPLLTKAKEIQKMLEAQQSQSLSPIPNAPPPPQGLGAVPSSASQPTGNLAGLPSGSI